MTERTTIELKNKVITLEIKDFGDSPIDTEDLLQVDYANIIGDMITFPVLKNRIGVLKAEMDNYLELAEFDFQVFEAEIYERYEKKLTKEVTNSRSTKLEAPTKTQVMNALLQTQEYKVKKYELFKLRKQSYIINSLWESAKSKDKKLDAISMKLRPEEFEKDILEETINDVMIKVHKNYFANKR